MTTTTVTTAAGPSSGTAPARTIPRDGRLLALILASKGIGDADERVIHQLLDFAHRYTAEVLQSAQSLSDHAARPAPHAARIEKEDVELAIAMRRRYEFHEAPPRDYLATLAHELNSVPLPPLPESFEVVRLPPANHRLTEVNFELVPTEAAGLVGAAGLSEGEEEEGSDSDSESDADGDVEEADGGEAAPAEADGDGDGEDDEMEEVGVPAEREVDEDYDA